MAAWGRIAQLVEHRTENPGVAGSIPAPPIAKTLVNRDERLTFFSWSRSWSRTLCACHALRLSFRTGSDSTWFIVAAASAVASGSA